MHQVGTSSLLIYMMHGHTYINFSITISSTPSTYRSFLSCIQIKILCTFIISQHIMLVLHTLFRLIRYICILHRALVMKVPCSAIFHISRLQFFSLDVHKFSQNTLNKFPFVTTRYIERYCIISILDKKTKVL